MPGPIPSVPSNFLVQPGSNLDIYLSWNPVTGADDYTVERSADNVTFSTLSAAITASNYTDSTGTHGTLYWYRVFSSNTDGDSNPTASQSATPVYDGEMSLGQVRLASQQRSDMVNSNFVTTQEWNSYINQSYTELYDMLIQVYGDEYYVAQYSFTTTAGTFPALYDLPDDFYKLMGVDLAIGNTSNGWLTLKKFSFISRNQYIYGNTPVSFLGVLNLRYRLVGSQIELVPMPSAGQSVRLWYIKRPLVKVADNDILDGISGWSEYIIVDAAIKAMQKEESDVSVLMAQKMALRQRIESAASNRDAGEPEVVSDLRRLDGSYFDAPWGPSGGA